MKVLLLTLCVNILIFTAYAECNLAVRVADYPPQYYQENGKWKGMAIELAEALFSESNCTPKYEIQPWKRAQDSIKEGRLHFMMNLSKTEERSKYMYFIGPQRDETMVLAVPESTNYTITSFDDFKKLPGKVGIQAGAFNGKKFQAKYESDKDFANKFDEVIKAEQLIVMLNGKRLSGFFIDRYDLAHKIKTDKKYKGIKYHSFFIHQDWNYFGLSKKSVSKDLLKQLNTAYDKAKAKNKFENVLKKYR